MGLMRLGKGLTGLDNGPHGTRNRFHGARNRPHDTWNWPYSMGLIGARNGSLETRNGPHWSIMKPGLEVGPIHEFYEFIGNDRVGHRVRFCSKRIVLLHSLKECNVLLRSFFEFLPTYETQKNDAFFCVLFLRT